MSTEQTEVKLYHGRTLEQIQATRAVHEQKVAAAAAALKARRTSEAAVTAAAAHQQRLARSAALRSQQNLFLQRAFGGHIPPVKKL
jgi:hypothetical protein